MSNILTTSFSYSVNGFRQYAIAISPSNQGTFPSIVGSPTFYNANISGATFSTSVTVPSGSNRVLFVVATWWYGTPGNATFGGVAMNRYIYSAGGLTGGLGIFWLANPTASTDTVLITLDTNPGTTVRTIGAFTTQGTDQTIPINNNADSESSGVSSTSVTCSPIVNYSFLFSTVSDYGFSGPVTNTTDGSQSELWNAHTGGTTVTTSGSTKNADLIYIDNLTCTESVSVTLVSLITEVETLAIVENLSIHQPFSPILNDQLTVSESVGVVLSINIQPVIFDTLSIDEDVTGTWGYVSYIIKNVKEILFITESIGLDSIRMPVGRPQIGRRGNSL